jgi:flagellar basal-body rod protein FlgC
MTGAQSIAASGLNANSAWLDAIASNIANMRDEATLPAPNAPYAGYQPVTVQMSAQAQSGVIATSEPLTPAYSAGYDPSAPFANAQGLVAVPNVDLASAVVDQTMALEGYRADATVFRAAEQMTKTLLDTVA